jgi:UDP-2,3-diacylglucosamine hydrolase
MAATPDPLPVESATLDRVELADTVIISDLHLSEATPRTLARFERFVAAEAAAHAELVILGDLFEAWVGDDDLDATLGRRVSTALAQATVAGQHVFLMHGNRDVLLGARFCAATGARLLADPAHARIQGTDWLLSHGDAWCVEDHAYQKFRAQVRAPAWQRAFLARTIEDRRAFVGAARAVSEADKRTKSFEIMDVTPAAVDAALRAAHGTRIVHGHTHRPGVHHGHLEGTAIERWVLPDWDFDVKKPADARGGYVAFTGGAARAVALSD